MRTTFLLSAFLILFSVSGSDFSTKVRPFVDKYCKACHGPEKQKSDLRLDTLPTDLNTLETAEDWQHVLDELNGATMPPDDEKQPTKKELSEILELLTFEIEKAKKNLYGKDREVVMRRMNRREYVNTIFDLTGIKLKEYRAPEDGKSSEFDTNGKGLFMSSYQFEKYLELGMEVIDRAVFEGSKPKVNTFEDDPEKRRNQTIEKNIKKIKERKNQSKAKDRNAEKDLEAFENYSKLEAAKKGAIISPYLCFSGSRKFFISQKFKPFHKNFQPGLYKFTIYAGVGGMNPGDSALINIDLDYREKLEVDNDKYFEVRAPFQKPQKIEFELYLDRESGFDIQSKITRKGKSTPYVVVDRIEMSGPHFESWPPPSHKKIFPIPQGDMSEKDYISKVIHSFTLKAFKYRKPTDDFLGTLNSIYHNNRQKGMPVNKAIQEPLSIVLASPKFLYMVEGSENSKYVRDFELASRLSYFLWSTKPDRELYKLAGSNQLHQPEVLKNQVKRMLIDQKSMGLAKGFVPQWLHLHKLDEVDVHRKRFPNYDTTVKSDMKLESIHFFNTIAERNLSMINFIDSDFITVNNVLKTYYGLPTNGKNEFEMVKLPKNSGRGGLLGQGAILVMTGNGTRTSPVMRGAFVMSKILGMPSPEPPPNVPQLESDKTKGLSIREALKVHQEQPQCSSCHKRIDPLGFGLENFDAAGVWHENINTSKKKNRSQPFDTAGKLPNGKKYNDIHDMKKLLLEHKDSFAKSLIESLLEYALGREIGFADAKLIDELLEKTKTNGYRLGDLIADIVAAPEFRQK